MSGPNDLSQNRQVHQWTCEQYSLATSVCHLMNWRNCQRSCYFAPLTETCHPHSPHLLILIGKSCSHLMSLGLHCLQLKQPATSNVNITTCLNLSQVARACWSFSVSVLFQQVNCQDHKCEQSYFNNHYRIFLCFRHTFDFALSLWMRYHFCKEMKG